MNNGLLKIQGNLTLSNNCDIVVGTGGKIVIDGGTFIPNKITLLPGSQLNIINNGILHPLYDFVANVGSEVNILKGQIHIKKKNYEKVLVYIICWCFYKYLFPNPTIRIPVYADRW